jgi:hypothetical protein
MQWRNERTNNDGQITTQKMKDQVKCQKIFSWLDGFWCLTPLSPIFQLYRGDQVY